MVDGIILPANLQPDILLDIFMLLHRSDLEQCELISRLFNSVINKHGQLLPVYLIEQVTIGADENARKRGSYSYKCIRMEYMGYIYYFRDIDVFENIRREEPTCAQYYCSSCVLLEEGKNIGFLPLSELCGCSYCNYLGYDWPEGDYLLEDQKYMQMLSFKGKVIKELVIHLNRETMDLLKMVNKTAKNSWEVLFVKGLTYTSPQGSHMIFRKLLTGKSKSHNLSCLFLLLNMGYR